MSYPSPFAKPVAHLHRALLALQATARKGKKHFMVFPEEGMYRFLRAEQVDGGVRVVYTDDAQEFAATIDPNAACFLTDESFGCRDTDGERLRGRLFTDLQLQRKIAAMVAAVGSDDD